jgi:hypothetical protein
MDYVRVFYNTIILSGRKFLIEAASSKLGLKRLRVMVEICLSGELKIHHKIEYLYVHKIFVR